MIPQEILSQLPPAFPKDAAQVTRLSASPASGLGESYLILAQGQRWLFVRDSLLDPLKELPLQGALRVIDESFDTFLYATTASGEEIKIKVSQLEKDSLQEALAQLTSEAGAQQIIEELAQQLTQRTQTQEAEIQEVIQKAEREAALFAQSAPPPVAPSALSPEEREAQAETLDAEAAEDLIAKDPGAALEKLSALCALSLHDPDDLDEYRKGVLALSTLLKSDDPRAAFFLSGDYESFYCEYQLALASYLGERLEQRGERLLAAAAYSASLDEESSPRLLRELKLSETQLRQQLLQEAIPFLQERLSQDPTDDLSMSYLASLLYEDGRDEESLALALKLIAQVPYRRDGYEQAVNAALSLKRLEEAQDLAQRAASQFPQTYWVHTLLGDVAEAKSDDVQGRKSYEESLRLAPGNVSALDGLQKILRRQHEHQALAALLESSLEDQSYKKEQLYEELAQLYEGPLKNPAKAKEFRRRVVTEERRRVATEEPPTPAETPSAPVPFRWSALLRLALLIFVIWLIWFR